MFLHAAKGIAHTLRLDQNIQNWVTLATHSCFKTKTFKQHSRQASQKHLYKITSFPSSASYLHVCPSPSPPQSFTCWGTSCSCSKRGDPSCSLLLLLPLHRVHLGHMLVHLHGEDAAPPIKLVSWPHQMLNWSSHRLQAPLLGRIAICEDQLILANLHNPFDKTTNSYIILSSLAKFQFPSQIRCSSLQGWILGKILLICWIHLLSRPWKKKDLKPLL